MKDHLKKKTMRKSILRTSSVFWLIFGLVSFFMTTSVIFGLFHIREMEGHYVLFIVYANGVCAILNLASSCGFFKEKKWTTLCLLISAGILVVAFTALLIYISRGGSYEVKTVKAMLLRIFVTLVFTGISWNYLSRQHDVIL